MDLSRRQFLKGFATALVATQVAPLEVAKAVESICESEEEVKYCYELQARFGGYLEAYIPPQFRGKIHGLE